MALWGNNYLVFSILISCYASHVSAHCIDLNSNIVSQGLHYVPGTNPCTVCICDKGSPKWCKSVLCSAPQNCKSFQVGNTCCEFKCLDDILTGTDSYKETYDVALRFIASAVTAVLSLSLLFFLFHRLRRRKLLLHHQNQQMSDDQRSLSSIGYIAGSLGYLPESYLSSGNNELEFHYEDASAHYSLWKPPGNYFPRGEAPPPYEEAVRSAQLESDLINTQLRTASNTILNSITSIPRNGVVVVGGTGAGAGVGVVGGAGGGGGSCSGNGGGGGGVVAAGRSAAAQAAAQLIQNIQDSVAATTTSSSSTSSTTCRHDNLNTVTTTTTTTSNNNNSGTNPHHHDINHQQQQQQYDLTPNSLIGGAGGNMAAPPPALPPPNTNQYVNITVQNVVVHNDGSGGLRQQQQHQSQGHGLDEYGAGKMQRKGGGGGGGKGGQTVEKAYENLPYGGGANKISVTREQRPNNTTTQSTSTNNANINKPHRDGRDNNNGRDRESMRERDSSRESTSHHIRYENIDRKHTSNEHNPAKAEPGYRGHHNSRGQNSHSQNSHSSRHLKNSRSQDSLRKSENSPASNIVNCGSTTNGGSTFRILDGYKNIEVTRNKDTMIITEGILPKAVSAKPTREEYYENTRHHSQHRVVGYAARKPHQEISLSLRKPSTSNQMKDAAMPLHRTLPKNVSDLLARSEETILDAPTTSSTKLLSSSAGGSWRDMGEPPASSKSHGNLTMAMGGFGAVNGAPGAADQLRGGGATAAVERAKCLISYQCLSSSQEDDDYRSECENCKSANMLANGANGADDAEDADVQNETMTLQRRPLEPQLGDDQPPYYRTSLTLPAHTRKPRVLSNAANREAWFTTMQETSSSDSE